MPSVPSVRAAETIRALERAGFVRSRQKGSHLRLLNPDTGRTTLVPLHPGDLPKPLLQTIIRQAGLTVEQFIELLRG